MLTVHNILCFTCGDMSLQIRAMNEYNKVNNWSEPVPIEREPNACASILPTPSPSLELSMSLSLSPSPSTRGKLTTDAF